MPHAKKLRKVTQLANSLSNPLKAVQRVLKFINEGYPIGSIYWTETIGLSLIDNVPFYPKLDILWLGCGGQVIDGDHCREYYLVEILNPNLDGRRCLVDLLDLGIQRICSSKHARKCMKDEKKKAAITVRKIDGGDDMRIGPGRDPGKLALFDKEVKVCGTAFDTTKPLRKDKTSNPYTLTFSGSRCVLMIEVSNQIIGPFPSGDQGSPPPPFTGGRPLVPR